MAVNELDRDYLKLLHMCDGIENIIGGMKMDQETDSEKKKQVGNMVMHLEMEILDSKYADASKDLTRINSTITSGRTYWKS
tara:strand:+ start:120 stop:362 length:243 start_codon:yes stop_codon:yes gene_type:complete